MYMVNVLQFAKSVISQSHLCPLPLHVLPIYWAFDHTLRLYPLPDVVICADKHDAYVETQSDCFVVNPVCMSSIVLKS